MRFIFKTDYEDDIRLLPHSGYVWTYGTLLVLLAIAPFVLSKIGIAAARELFVTGRRFTAERAKEIGLVHAVVPMAELDRQVAGYVAEILAAGPEAVAAAKSLLRQIAGKSAADVRGLTARTLAARRASAEGQEGLRAFLEKQGSSRKVARA